MSNVVADLLPLSAVAILSFIAWLDIRCGTLVEVVPAISKGKKPLLGMYTQTVSKGHHFSLMDESGCCGFHYNLTLDLQNLSAVVEKARERWWRCSAG